MADKVLDNNTIYWGAVCGNHSPFWDPSLLSNTSQPDLARCFQGTVLSWTPCIILWLISILYLPALCSSPSVNHSWKNRSLLNVSKVVGCILLFLVTTVGLIVTISNINDSTAPYQIITPSIHVVTYIFAGVLTHMEYTKGRHTSAPLFIFWTLLTFLSILPFRTNIIEIQKEEVVVEGEDMFHFVLFYVWYLLLLVQVLLTLFADLKAVKHMKSFSEDEIEKTPLLGDTHQPDKDLISNSGHNHNLPACPESYSSILSLITNWWVTRLFITGYKRPLVFEDLYQLKKKDTSSSIVHSFSSDWKRRVNKWRKKYNVLWAGTSKKEDNVECLGRTAPPSDNNSLSLPSLLLTMMKTSSADLIYSIILRSFTPILNMLNPILLQYLIQFVDGDEINSWKGYLFSLGLLLANVATAFFQHNYMKYCYIVGMRSRTAVITSIYRKALRLAPSTRRSTTTGEIVNIMSVDAQRIHDFCCWMHESWACLLSLIFAVTLLYFVIGPVAFTSLLVFLILLPLNSFLMGKYYTKLQHKQMEKKDFRIKLMNEMLAGIKVLKMYAWEPSYTTKVTTIREKELKYVKQQGLIGTLVDTVFMCTSYLVSLVVFGFYVLLSPDNILDASTAFVSLSVINIMNWSISVLPITILFGSQAYTSMNRVRKMLLKEEVDPAAVDNSYISENAVDIQDGTFTWDQDEPPILHNISAQIPDGSLVAVVGQVGCGKSSLISAILGEMHKKQGSVNVKGSIAYVPQQAWILNATVKDNILFGKEMDESKYKKVIEACALEPDFKILTAGDMTEIGEKGVNLSGGQKQRVSLARAVYQSKDLYLFDDPLSAVDSHVGKHIFQKVIGPKGILRGQTRILVTHGLTYLSQTDQVIVLKQGRISEVGTYKELLSKASDFAELIDTYLKELSDASSEENDEAIKATRHLIRQLSSVSCGAAATENQLPLPSLRKRKREVSTRQRTISMLSGEGTEVAVKTNKQTPQVPDKLITEEEAEVGKVQWKVIKDYVEAGGFWRIYIVLLFCSLRVASLVSTNIWLSMWSDDPVYQNVTEQRDHTNMRLAGYGFLGAFQFVSVSGVILIIVYGGVHAARNLHDRLINGILHAPMAFFDTTPLGRIVNRFSADMDKIDVTIPLFSRFWVQEVSQLIATLILISYSTPIFLATVLPIILFYYFIQRIYISTVRQLKRIESIKRSPIYVHFDETLSGASSIRAYCQQDSFIAKNDRLMDENQMAWYPILIAQRWLGISLDIVAAVIVFLASLFAVMQRDTLSAGLAGLSVSFSMQTVIFVNIMVRDATELETNIVSAERIQEYTEIESEAPWKNEDNQPDTSWPAEGEVIFENYSTRYRPGLDLVLKGITIKVEPQEKVGIVGRTGAGKSSMTLSLFRIIEAAAGRIVIDGVPIQSIGLHDLRKKLTIIPQDPVIFSGTLLSNLDPFKLYNIEEIWRALELAHLKKFVSSLPAGLEYECGEGGEALSVGQRQLVCLARAVLRKTKVLILDEATAAVDMETDELIQATITSEFTNCTVLTIAHRLNTIMEYDRVMVFDEGEVKEFDTPTKLLQDTKTIFYGMAKDAGLV